MTSIIIVSPDIVNSYMAGPGIRYWEIAHALANYANVTLAVPGETPSKSERFEIITYGPDGGAIRDRLRAAEAVLVQGLVLRALPFLKDAPLSMIVDLYDPFLFENLETRRVHPRSLQCAIHNHDLLALLEQLQRGDFFICASERQRDYWLGALAAARRVTPELLTRDPSLRSLIDTVPFGLPSSPPTHSRRVLKGIVPGIRPDDRVVIWGGGLWAWLDPLLLIRAFEAVATLQPNARLFFLGAQHPNPTLSRVDGLSLYRDAIKLAKRLRLAGRFVFFNDHWVRYDERQNYLLEADIGVSLHQHTIEMRYAWRTRLLDYIWCGLPVIVSAGDAWSEKVQSYGLGRVVPVDDIDALVAALVEMLAADDLKRAYASNFQWIRSRMTWGEVIRPLVNFLGGARSASATAELVATTL